MKISDIKGKIDFGIITILEDEFKAILDRFPGKDVVAGERHYRISQVKTFDSVTANVAVVRCPEQGPGVGQDVTRDMISDLDPQWLLLVGIGGGVPSDEFTLGDVVVATRLHDFSIEAVIEKRAPEYSVAGGPMHREVQDLLAHLPAMEQKLSGWNDIKSIKMKRPPVDFAKKNFYGDLKWKRKTMQTIEKHFKSTQPRQPLVKTGSIASSGKLVKDSKTIKTWLRTARHINAIEMELAGVYLAARRKNREYPVIAIRGISDIVGFARDEAWKAYACNSAAAFTKAFITKCVHIKPRTQELAVCESGAKIYDHVVKIIKSSEHKEEEYRTIFLAALHGHSGRRKLSRFSRNKTFSKFDKAMLNCVKSKGEKMWRVRELYNITTEERLKEVVGWINKNSGCEGYEVRAFCAPSSIPHLAPLIIGKDHLFLGIEDDRYFRVQEGLYLFNCDAVKSVRKYWEMMWNDREIFVLKDNYSVKKDVITALRECIKKS